MPSFLFSIIFSQLHSFNASNFIREKTEIIPYLNLPRGVANRTYLYHESQWGIRHRRPVLSTGIVSWDHTAHLAGQSYSPLLPLHVSVKKNINKILHIFLSYRLGCFLEHLCLWMIANTCVYSVYKNIGIHVHVYRNIGILVNSYRVILFRFLDESTGLSVCHKGL